MYIVDRGCVRRMSQRMGTLLREARAPRRAAMQAFRDHPRALAESLWHWSHGSRCDEGKRKSRRGFLPSHDCSPYGECWVIVAPAILLGCEDGQLFKIVLGLPLRNLYLGNARRFLFKIRPKYVFQCHEVQGLAWPMWKAALQHSIGSNPTTSNFYQ